MTPAVLGCYTKAEDLAAQAAEGWNLSIRRDLSAFSEDGEQYDRNGNRSHAAGIRRIYPKTPQGTFFAVFPVGQSEGQLEMGGDLVPGGRWRSAGQFGCAHPQGAHAALYPDVRGPGPCVRQPRRKDFAGTDGRRGRTGKKIPGLFANDGSGH